MHLDLGSLQFTIEYIPTLMQLKIHLISATSLPARDSNGLSDPYVKLHLLPGIAKVGSKDFIFGLIYYFLIYYLKNKATKLRSKTIYKNLNPVFNEIFHYNGVTLEDMDAKVLR